MPQWCWCATASELGHLYYDELGLPPLVGNAAHPSPRLTEEELNAGIFDNLAPSQYMLDTWSVLNTPWLFDMDNGNSDYVAPPFVIGPFRGLAVRAGQVSAMAEIPSPATGLLVATGLALLFGAERMRRTARSCAR